MPTSQFHLLLLLFILTTLLNHASPFSFTLPTTPPPPPTPTLEQITTIYRKLPRSPTLSINPYPPSSQTNTPPSTPVLPYISKSHLNSIQEFVNRKGNKYPQGVIKVKFNNLTCNRAKQPSFRSETNALEELEKKTVEQLKTILLASNLKRTGLKADLIDRILTHRGLDKPMINHNDEIRLELNTLSTLLVDLYNAHHNADAGTVGNLHIRANESTVMIGFDDFSKIVLDGPVDDWVYEVRENKNRMKPWLREKEHDKGGGFGGGRKSER